MLKPAPYIALSKDMRTLAMIDGHQQFLTVYSVENLSRPTELFRLQLGKLGTSGTSVDDLAVSETGRYLALHWRRRTTQSGVNDLYVVDRSGTVIGARLPRLGRWLTGWSSSGIVGLRKAPSITVPDAIQQGKSPSTI